MDNATDGTVVSNGTIRYWDPMQEPPSEAVQQILTAITALFASSLIAKAFIRMCREGVKEGEYFHLDGLKFCCRWFIQTSTIFYFSLLMLVADETRDDWANICIISLNLTALLLPFVLHSLYSFTRLWNPRYLVPYFFWRFFIMEWYLVYQFFQDYSYTHLILLKLVILNHYFCCACADFCQVQNVYILRDPKTLEQEGWLIVKVEYQRHLIDKKNEGPKSIPTVSAEVV